MIVFQLFMFPPQKGQRLFFDLLACVAPYLKRSYYITSPTIDVSLLSYRQDFAACQCQ